MFWWIPVIIPLVGIIVILISPLWPIAKWQGARYVYEIQENYKKFGLYAFVNIIICILIAALCWLGAISKTRFPEVWNYKITGIRHEMKWTTEELRSRQVPCGSDEDGHTQYCTEFYTETETHGPYFIATDEYGLENFIYETEYIKCKSLWKNEQQTGMHKGSAAGWDKKIDGPIYECSWPNTFETIWPGTSIRRYVNKIRVSNSILNYGEATKEQKSRFPRPADKGDTSPFINCGGPNISDNNLLYLKQVNASLGKQYEIHPMLVVFGKNETRGVVTDVLSTWQGPNKNELVTFMSLDGQEIKWVEVHSWVDDTTIHAVLRDELMGKPFTVQRYGELLRKFVPKYWHRKHFTPINAYLHIPISSGWVVFGVILSTVSGVFSFIIINKQG